MKLNLKHLQSLAAVALCVIMAITFAGCGNDDNDENETEETELARIVVGTWAQDGDNDILTINANGTGVGYDNPTAYQNNQVGYTFKWTYNNGWVTVTSSGEIVEEMRPMSFSQNKIVWQRYIKDSSDGDGYDKDAFGYYELWTWERYIK